VDNTAELTTRYVGALADLGLRTAVISPGSRSSPLSLAFVLEPRIEVHVLHDERSAAFFALGAAKALGSPTAVVATSGTAAAHYHPAVIEASHARIPLLVHTADRPPELRGSGAPQTVDQIKLFGDTVRLFHDLGVPDPPTAASARSVALRAWSAALDPPPGPVHLNFPFREPLATPPEPAPPNPALRHVPGYPTLEPEGLRDLASRLSGRRALIVAGGRQRPGFAVAAALLAGEAGLPILADIQCRFPSPATMSAAPLLADAGVLERLAPEVVLRIGAIPTSKALWRWMESSDVEQLFVDDGSWRDPLGSVTTAYRSDPATTLIDLAGRVDPAPDDWLASWRTADAAISATAASALGSEPFPTEPGAIRATWESAPVGSTVYVGSSMPIRDLDAYAGEPRGDLDVLANRGANGIDGLLSASAGAAIAAGHRVTAIAGDLSVLHDATALATIARYEIPVTVVVLNNDGGGIFHFLPQASEVDGERFEQVFGTPHGLSLAEVSEAFGVPARRVEVERELRDAVRSPGAGPLLIEVHTDRTENVAVHDRLHAAMAQALP
jgi:2-succinyl-5-enolpyruvyl-6-hydroxy-3-cyclohexene-1-carboxylate synthase